VIDSVIKFLKQRGAEVWSVWAATFLTALMGIINILSAVTPAFAYRLRLIAEFLPLIVRRSGRLSASLAGFALLLLADKLRQRKRVAWLLTIIVLIVSVISHLLKGFDFEEAILATLLAGWLLTTYPHFHAHSDPPSIKQGLKILFFALIFTLAYGVIGFYLLDRHFSVNFGFWQAVQQTVIMFAEFYDPGLQPVTSFGRYFADSIYIVGATTMGYALIMLVRPVFIYHPACPDDKNRAQTMVAAYGRTALARYTLFEDKLHFFSMKGTVISYVVKGRVALTLGDPIGPHNDCLQAILEFIKYCKRNDWQPVFYQTLPDYLDLYQSVGLNVICIGHEAIVNLATFTLEGKAGKSLRTPINRLTKLCFQAQMHEPPLSDLLIHQLQIISDEWLTSVHSTEKRFSLGWFEREYIRNSQVMTIMAADGTITAFANINPEYQHNEVTVDLMRRCQYAEPGTMEYLFVSLFQWAKKNGYDTFNLGLSALAGVGKGAKDPIVEKALYYIYEHLNQFYNFKGLHAFKTKFQPVWEPRYLVYPGPASLPSVLTALVRADSGDDFIWKYFKRIR
jgi:phosphatidylglycerol lysyltransferase